jgi:bacteriocin biosynthesis cyclodehydratase domain-containing protein
MIVLTVGTFGSSVGERLRQRCDAEVVALTHERASLQSAVARASFVAVAAWRPYVATFRLLDELCHDAGVPWSLAELHNDRLTCGPLMYPGAGACYHCYRMRWSSHHPAPQREMVLERAYARNPQLGPPGFIRPLVEAAAAALLEDSRSDSSQAGRLRVLDVLTGAVLESAVIPVHGCPRCYPNRPAGGERFVHKLVPALREVLS